MAHKLASYGNVVVVRWVGQPQTGEVQAMFDAVRDAHTRTKKPVIYIAIHDTDSLEPNVAVQQEAMNGWDVGMRNVTVAYFVLASSSLVAPLQRSFYQAMLFVAKKRGTRGTEKMQWASSIDEVIAKEGPRLPVSPDVFRAQLRRDGLIPEISGALR